MTADNEFFVHWIPKAPGFDTLRIAHKDTLSGVWLERFSVPFTDEDISKAAKDTEI